MKKVFIKFIFLIISGMSFSQCPQVLEIDNFNGFDTYPVGFDHWQSFTNITTGKLTKMSVSCLADPFIFTLSIYEGSGLAGQLLYTNDYTITTGPGWKDIDIPVILAPNVIGGMQYTYRLQSATSFTSYTQSGNPYSGGVFYSDGGGLQTDLDASFRIYISKSSPPISSFSAINNIRCFGSADGSIVTNVSAGYPQFSFLWLPSGQTTQNATGLLAGNHKFIVTDSEGCVDSIFTTINEPADIVLDAGLDETICKGESLNLNATSPNADNFIWLNNTDLSSSIIPNPIATPKLTTIYIVTVENSTGCVKSDSVEIFVDQDCSIFFSNTISCNNDGVNDTWEIQGIESFPDNKVTIYNRWGDVIFEAENYDNTLVVWDGKLANQLDANPGTYFYNVTIKNGQIQNGWIELLR